MFFLPRICEHCLNPSCVASCPSGAMYKRAEDGIVLVDQDQCRGWRMCVTGCPYKKVYFNHRTGKAEKCTFCYPRVEVGLPTVCSETCVGRLRYIGPVPLRRRPRHRRGVGRRRARPLRGAAGPAARPARPAVVAGARREGISRRLDHGRPALAGLPAGQAVPRRAAAAPGVPHDADGLVRAAALAGGRPAHRDRATTARPPATCSARSTRCASPSSTSRSCSPRATPSRSAGCCGQLAAMRSYMRDVTLDRPRDESIAAAVGRPAASSSRCTGCWASPSTRSATSSPPPTRAPTWTPRTSSRSSACSLDVDGGPGMLGSGPFGEASRQAGAGVGRDLPRVAGPADRATRSPTPAARAPGSTCSTGTARAAPTASSHRRATHRIPPPTPRRAPPAERGDGS